MPMIDIKTLAAARAGGGSGSGGGVSSWNDLTDKPFGETEETVSETLNITWDGNTEGLVNVQGALYKVSDVVVANIEDVKNLVYKLNYNPDEVSVANMWENIVASSLVTDDCIYAEGFAVARKDGATISAFGFDLVFPEKGIYFFTSNGDYVECLKSSVPISVVKTETKTLDPKYLPEGVGGDNTFVLTYEADPINGSRVTQSLEDIISAYQSGKELVLYAHERKWEHAGELAFQCIANYDLANGYTPGLFYIVAQVVTDGTNAVVFTSYSITHTEVVEG